MAKRRKKTSLAQQVVGVATLAMPEPVKRVATTKLGSTAIIVSLPLLLATGIMTVHWENGWPKFQFHQERAQQVKQELKQELGEELQKVAEGKLPRFAEQPRTEAQQFFDGTGTGSNEFRRPSNFQPAAAPGPFQGANQGTTSFAPSSQYAPQPAYQPPSPPVGGYQPNQGYQPPTSYQPNAAYAPPVNTPAPLAPASSQSAPTPAPLRPLPQSNFQPGAPTYSPSGRY